MKIYLLQVKTYNYLKDIIHDEYVEVFNSFDRAKEFGLEFLTKKIDRYCKNKNKSIKYCIKDEDIGYEFSITEQDLNYSRNFDKKIDYFDEIEEYLVYEPTHKEYYLDCTGKVVNIGLYYLPNQKDIRGQNHLYIQPNDLLKSAGTKFEIGDIVRLKNFDVEDMAYTISSKGGGLYVVRFLPRRIEGQKYLRNTYALSEITDDNYSPGIYTWEYHENQIERYEGEIEKNSPIDVLSRIYKGEIEVDKDTWNKLKCGIISFKDEDKNSFNYYKKELKLEEKENG